MDIVDIIKFVMDHGVELDCPQICKDECDKCEKLKRLIEEKSSPKT